MKKARLLSIGLGIVLLIASYGSSASAQAPAPVAGAEVVGIGVTVTQLTEIVKGWSVKKKILGQDVYNDKDEKVGSVDDIIIGPDKAVTFAIIGAGGFLGIDKHDVAIPVKQFQEKEGKFILPGATKEAVKKMPPFMYAK
ncbi:MAG: PRC-barrel domain-containing protein [Deltaproteobacteria bacterium]|nr:PRC-barrel domain-containing protein [Deltaproteobacteria bacterium]